ncbi:unnamed protein product [Linum trigynum]|uniref:Uncharacterized protein n=1 Tax=Linum trigynum TaxID=586398 RepID=A0AAV2FA35_9ROSI
MAFLGLDGDLEGVGASNPNPLPLAVKGNATAGGRSAAAGMTEGARARTSEARATTIALSTGGAGCVDLERGGSRSKVGLLPTPIVVEIVALRVKAKALGYDNMLQNPGVESLGLQAYEGESGPAGIDMDKVD